MYHSCHQGECRFAASIITFCFVLTTAVPILLYYQTETQSNYLARNVDVDFKTDDDDPMVHVEGLRSHLYMINVKASLDNSNTVEIMERLKMIDMLQNFVTNYRTLLICASTPIPFPLLQMGRTFLFLWTFTIPLVLRGVVSEVYAGMAFCFFLTYGFIGLELVAMKLMFPFGDDVNDLNVTGMKEVSYMSDYSTGLYNNSRRGIQYYQTVGWWCSIKLS